MWWLPLKQNCLRHNWDINFLTDSKHGGETKNSFQCNCKAIQFKIQMCIVWCVYCAWFDEMRINAVYTILHIVHTLYSIHCKTMQGIVESDSLFHFYFLQILICSTAALWQYSLNFFLRRFLLPSIRSQALKQSIRTLFALTFGFSPLATPSTYPSLFWT